MSKTKINVSHVAKLANLTLNPEEEKRLEKQLAEVLSHIEKLDSLDTKDIEPTAQTTRLENVTRKDIVGESFSQKEATSQAERVNNGLFEVKGIFEDE